METVIYTENLTKSYKNVSAVDRVSLSVKKGEIYGFLGLNGAGKTTAIRMMLGMIRPTSGACFINGQKVNPGRHHMWRDVGYMVETPYAYPELTVRENLEIASHLRQMQGVKRVSDIIQRLNLNAYEHKKAKYLSMGNAQRLGIAKALLHQPQILLLDEPANGLDPAGIVEIRELLKELAYENGTAIFISSHILGEVSKVASKIGIIHEGRLIQELSKRELEDQRMIKLVLETQGNRRAAQILREGGYTVWTNEKGRLETQDKRAVEHPEQIAKMLSDAHNPPKMLWLDEEDLESYFLRVIGKKGEDVHAADARPFMD
ncbi:ABC transporter ATP-binding protein [Halobacillus massiliensis]|uniref:ABC transporter ATP-binding protein n=1 Tax=Halobacillus massiliensis TaxID=1926286 RepID=UPI001C4DEC11|nr:ABC transporter ATP-binding protein [Halobacillus massiliensis]